MRCSELLRAVTSLSLGRLHAAVTQRFSQSGNRMARHAELAAQQAEGADPEDPDECCAAGIFWAPKQARWSHLKASAPQPTIGKLVDDAMAAIERDKPDPQGRAAEGLSVAAPRQAAPRADHQPRL